MTATRAPYAIICGGYVNAYSIAQSLKAIGWEGSIVCLKDAATPALVDIRKDVETWNDPLSSPVDVIRLISTRLPAEASKIVFLTDERFHEALRDGIRSGSLHNTRLFLGAANCLETILDRYEFCRFIETRQLGSVPKTIGSDVDPWATFVNRFFLRFKRSWRGIEKLPRVRPVSDKKTFKKIVTGLRDQGYREEEWCYQEILSTSPRHNVSISGWHSADHQTYLATRKVLQHPAETGNGDVCELIETPPGLAKTTERLLTTLGYEGPFELEFVLDTKADQYKMIELNPRFWMQHGLIGAATGQELICRYIGRTPGSPPPLPPKYWVNSVYAMFRLMRLDLRICRYIYSSSTLLVPSWSETFKWLPLLASKKFRSHLPRRTGRK